MKTTEYDITVPSELNWQLVQNESKFQVYVNDFFVCVKVDATQTYSQADNDYSIGTINSAYRPMVNTYTLSHNTSMNTRVYISNFGNIYTNSKTVGSSAIGVKGLFVYPRQSALP